MLTRGSGVDDYQGLRAWQPGDPRRRLHWKAYSRGQGLLVKDFASLLGNDPLLDFDALTGDTEQRLSVLCHWVIDLSEKQQPFALRLPAGLSARTAASASRCLPACAGAARPADGAMHECEAGYSAQQPDLAAGGAGAGDPAASHPSAAVDHRPVAGCAGWRIQIFRMRARYPRSWTKALLMIAAGFGVYFSRGSLVGLEAGVVLLIAAFILKLVEMSTRRDALVLIFLGFFAVVTSYLFEDSLLAALYSLLPVTALLAAMIGLQQSSLVTRPWPTVRLAGALLLQAVPLMLVLFLFFPRLPPLWSRAGRRQGYDRSGRPHGAWRYRAAGALGGAGVSCQLRRRDSLATSSTGAR